MWKSEFPCVILLAALRSFFHLRCAARLRQDDRFIVRNRPPSCKASSCEQPTSRHGSDIAVVPGARGDRQQVIPNRRIVDRANVTLGFRSNMD